MCSSVVECQAMRDHVFSLQDRYVFVLRYLFLAAVLVTRVIVSISWRAWFVFPMISGNGYFLISTLAIIRLLLRNSYSGLLPIWVFVCLPCFFFLKLMHYANFLHVLAIIKCISNASSHSVGCFLNLLVGCFIRQKLSVLMVISYFCFLCFWGFRS